MAFELRQELKLTRQLVMTPQLQQAIKLLQLSRLELLDTVQQEMNENPFLEEAGEEETQYITPDIYVYKVDDEYVVALGEDGLPKLRISSFYRGAVLKSSSAGQSTHCGKVQGSNGSPFFVKAQEVLKL